MDRSPHIRRCIRITVLSVVIASTVLSLAVVSGHGQLSVGAESVDTSLPSAQEPATTGELPALPAESVALQTNGAIHQIAALVGIGALILLGGGLLLRNRLDQDRSQASESAQHPPEEFLTDRERVRHLVTENGGRMKQSAIVDSVEWSKAKVSRLLADLESEGEITKLRLGRENLICLRGEEPAASKSPERAENE